MAERLDRSEPPGWEELPGSVGAFLRAVGRELPLGTRDYLRVADLMQQAEGQAPRTLRAMVVSSLARCQEEWQRIDQIYRDCFEQAREEPPTAERPQGPGQRAVPPAAARLVLGRPSRWLRPRARLADLWLSLRSRWRRLVAWGGLLVVLCGGLAAGVLYVTQALAPRIIVETATPQSTGLPPRLDLQELRHYRATLRVEASVAKRAPRLAADKRAVAIVLLLLWALAVLSLRLWWLPPFARAARREQARVRQERGKARRRTLLRASGDDTPLRPAYHIQVRYRRCPLSVAALEDSAILLGRVQRQERGEELAVPPTLAETVAAGGRLVPVYQPRAQARDLLVLLDEEGGAHPYLGAAQQVLSEWLLRGVRLHTYRFRSDPGRVRDLRGWLLLSSLRRLHDGAALLLVSRRLPLQGPMGQLLEWPEIVRSWPLRAWLDPDPRTEAERLPSEARDIEELLGQGLHRFPLSDRGGGSAGAGPGHGAPRRGGAALGGAEAAA